MRGGGVGAGGRGRGEYYRNKYGGGRSRGGGGTGGGGDRGGYQDRGNGSGGGSDRGYSSSGAGSAVTRSAEELRQLLRRIDGAGYGAYRDMEGAYEFGPGVSRTPFRLVIDRTQSDPFAPPSRMHVIIPGPVAGFPAESYQSPIRQIAMADYLARRFVEAARSAGDDQRTESGGWSGKKGGEITMEVPGQHVLARTNVLVKPKDGSIEARFTVALPARGRSIEGSWCARILLERLPDLINRSLIFRALNAESVKQHILCVEDQEVLRSLLPQAGAIAFVRNGAVLPRKGGDSDEPMAGDEVIRFQSPPSLEREVTLPNCGKIKGMAIPRGITLIVGGGFHGKSTLLQALEVGVYNHLPGDGREFVVVNPTAVKIRAEDGRSVKEVNITPFIDNLPFGKLTNSFCTPDASGSTSQAANIIEALEVGSEVLLMDEDTCATNFMIRDLRMQMLVSKDKEPITPFISKVKSLYTHLGVSSILVIGGAGDYFDVADVVVMMDSYSPLDKTQDAKGIASQFAAASAIPSTFNKAGKFGSLSRRYLHAPPLQTQGKVVARGKEKIQYGEIDVDLAAVEQLAEVGQTRAIGAAMRTLGEMIDKQPNRSIKELVEALEKLIDAEGEGGGLDSLEGPGMFVGNMARPRKFEIAAALNRFRALSAVSQPFA